MTTNLLLFTDSLACTHCQSVLRICGPLILNTGQCRVNVNILIDSRTENGKSVLNWMCICICVCVHTMTKQSLTSQCIDVKWRVASFSSIWAFTFHRHTLLIRKKNATFLQIFNIEFRWNINYIKWINLCRYFWPMCFCSVLQMRLNSRIVVSHEFFKIFNRNLISACKKKLCQRMPHIVFKSNYRIVWNDFVWNKNPLKQNEKYFYWKYFGWSCWFLFILYLNFIQKENTSETNIDQNRYADCDYVMLIRLKRKKNTNKWLLPY